jgi:4-hydroxy-tetrahydrodipicolinate reductase
MDGYSEPPKLVLLGAGGRMGATIASYLLYDRKVELVGAVDPANAGTTIGELLDDDTELQIVSDVDDLPSDLKADLVLDFSIAASTRANLYKTLERGWDALIGVTGFNWEDKAEFTKLALQYKRRIVIVPNFTIGINLLMKFCRESASKFMHAEIIELHHDKKLDAPSGTAINTAQIIAEARDRIEPPSSENASRGEIIDGIPVHSVRMRGMLAHQEVIFGNDGEILTIRHDTMDRKAFMPGIYLAIKKLEKLPHGLEVGLEWAFD